MFLSLLDEEVAEAVARCVLWKKGVLKSFAKSTDKHQVQSHHCQSLFFKKIARLCSGLTIKTPERNLAFWCFFCKLWTLACNWHRCFPVNFAKFLRATFLQNNSVRLLLQWYHYSFNVLEVYIETSQISKTELFAKIVKELKAIFAKTSFWCFYC